MVRVGLAATGASPSASSRASTKRSIGFLAQRCVADRRRRRPARRLERPVLAPGARPGRSIVSRFRSGRRVSFLPDFGGGITSSGSVLVMRRISSLSPLLPGTMTGSLVRRAPSFTSSRRSALRVLASGPWQMKQFSERIGRMSRLKSTGSGPAERGGKAVPGQDEAQAEQPAPRRPQPGRRRDAARRPSGRVPTCMRSGGSFMGGMMQVGPTALIIARDAPPVQCEIARRARHRWHAALLTAIRIADRLSDRSQTSRGRRGAARDVFQPGAGGAVRADHDGAAAAVLLSSG